MKLAANIHHERALLKRSSRSEVKGQGHDQVASLGGGGRTAPGDTLQG